MRTQRNEVGNRFSFAVWSALTLAAALLITTGCGVEDPASPEPDAASPWIVDAPHGDSSLGKTRGAPWAPIPVHAEVPINPSTGGQLVSGRQTLTVPPGALPWTVPFTMDYYTTGIVRVELGPHGAQFAVPVTLTFDLNGTSALPSDDITLYWWNEASGEWVDVGGVWDPSTMTLTAELDHLSVYQPGRGGW
jgi:hypothetical protein